MCPLELDTLVFTEAESLRPAFQARGLRLLLDLPEEPARVLANEQALRAMVVALLENALQHTAKGERSGWRCGGASFGCRTPRATPSRAQASGSGW
ncbi:histidine kinase [Thermus thermophilus]|nr:histidine kinase [Thermus thermophilus]